MSDLSKRLRGITPNNGTQKEIVVPVVRTLPDNEVQHLIAKECEPFDGMHYDNILSVIGRLVSGHGITHDQLLSNSDFFLQYISPDSETLKNKTIDEIIKDLQGRYGDQVGTRPIKKAPADCFSEQVYDNLDPRLKNILDQIPDHRKKDIALIGVITALSAAASRYRFFHGTNGDVKEYSAHILALVIGQAGAGKGNTRYGNILVEQIAAEAIRMRKEAMIFYKQQKAEYDRQKKQRDKSGQDYNGLIEPERPKKYAFWGSASDTTAAALTEMLYENPIGIYAYDSELDSLTQGNQKKDFGGFSDQIRKCSHHEPLSRQRKTEGESYNVYEPRLALCLSGTPDQLKKLIQSEYNGLFSRFWYYVIPPTFQEYVPGILQQDIVGDRCRLLSGYILEQAALWIGEIIHIQFTEQQENELKAALQDKKSIEDRFGGDTGASWLRMALIVKRIAVTMAWFEQATGEVPARCWRVAIGLLPALKTHNLAALDLVRQNQGKAAISKEQYEAYKGEGLSDEKISKLLGVNRSTIDRRKKEWFVAN